MANEKPSSPISQRRSLFRDARRAAVTKGAAVARKTGAVAARGGRALVAGARRVVTNKRVRESAADVVIDEGTSLTTHGVMYALDRHQEMSGPVPWYKRRSTIAAVLTFVTSLGLRWFAPKSTIARRVTRRALAGNLHAILGHSLRARLPPGGPPSPASTSGAEEEEDEPDGDVF